MDDRFIRTPAALGCLLCGKKYSEDARHFDGCPDCKSRGVSSNLYVVPDDSALSRDLVSRVLDRARSMPSWSGIWRYRELLPVRTAPEPISLGEGCTPLIKCTGLGKSLGYSSLYLKNEAQNPTASFKDRLACAVVNNGIALGERLFVWSSSGNAGTSAAAYAARAGARSIGLMSSLAPDGMRIPAAAHGALVIMTHDRADRQGYMTQMVSAGAYPTSSFASVNGMPVGSNPYGTEGYRTIAYEIYTDLGNTVPDYVVSPTCYGDQVLGIARGFEDLHNWGLTPSIPKMIAALPPAGAPACISTGRYETAQTKVAIRISDGSIVDTIGTNDDVFRVQQMLAAGEGVFLEPSSAASFLALGAAGVPYDKSVVVIGTASGWKDLAASQQWVRAMPVAQGTDGLERTLQDVYGTTLRSLLAGGAGEQ